MSLMNSVRTFCGRNGRITTAQIPVLNSNYAFIIKDNKTGATACVDPGEANPILEAMDGLKIPSLDIILCTHHHDDHVGGIGKLKKATGAVVYGPAGAGDRIAGLDNAVSGGDVVALTSASAEDEDPQRANVIDVPYHTKDHIALHFEREETLFVGDALFSLGCGKLFEGTPAQLAESLALLAALPPSTMVFCGHEITADNGEFALEVEPDNEALIDRIADVLSLRDKGEPTLPTTIGLELETNPFLRPQSATIRKNLGMSEGASDVDVLAALREAKDKFVPSSQA